MSQWKSKHLFGLKTKAPCPTDFVEVYRTSSRSPKAHLETMLAIEALLPKAPADHYCVQDQDHWALDRIRVVYLRRTSEAVIAEVGCLLRSLGA
jgi:hypothetical protein